MPSPVISDSQRQLTLAFNDDLLHAHRSLRDCVASGVYRRGLKTVAMDLDLSPGNLSVALSDDPHRKFSVDDLERYIQTSGDKSPIYYLVGKYLADEGAAREHALSELLQQLPHMLAAAGLNTTPARRR
jgi:hypothetical protein